MNNKLSATLAIASFALLLIAVAMNVYLVLEEASHVIEPDDVYELLQSGEVVVDAPDRWTGSDQREFADINNLKMPKKE